MKSLTCGAVFFTAVLITGAWQAALGDMVVDDFESYHNGQIVGPTAGSTPWLRFGGATNDNVVATKHEKWLVSGATSGLYGLVWPNPFGAIRRVFDQPMDVSAYRAASVKMLSDTHRAQTMVRFAVSNGPTTFVSVKEYTLDTRPQQMVFPIGMDKMVRVVGSDGYAAVLQGALKAGFDFRSTGGEGYETVVFDDFVLHDEVPTAKEEEKVTVAD